MNLLKFLKVSPVEMVPDCASDLDKISSEEATDLGEDFGGWSEVSTELRMESDLLDVVADPDSDLDSSSVIPSEVSAFF